MFTTPEVIINGKRHICLFTLAQTLQYNPTYTRFLASSGTIPGTKRRGRWYFHLPTVLQALGWQESKSNEPTTRINKAIASKDILAGL